MRAGERSLRTQNAAWLWAVAGLDSALLAALHLWHGPDWGSDISEFMKLAGFRAAITTAAPVLVLLLTSLLPADAKAALVFWRVRDVLPGHRAFSVHALHDPRVDLASLKKNVGAFPEAPREQNSFWYKLFKKVESDTAVGLAHRHYLLFRDLAAMSFVLLVAVPTGLCLFGADGKLITQSSILFVVQYLLSAVAGRLQGVRFVTTVLALHSVERRR
jgi:hypothetical protein